MEKKLNLFIAIWIATFVVISTFVPNIDLNCPGACLSNIGNLPHVTLFEAIKSYPGVIAYGFTINLFISGIISIAIVFILSVIEVLLKKPKKNYAKS